MLRLIIINRSHILLAKFDRHSYSIFNKEMFNNNKKNRFRI